MQCWRARPDDKERTQALAFTDWESCCCTAGLTRLKKKSAAFIADAQVRIPSADKQTWRTAADLNSRCKAVATNPALSSLRQSVAILPTTLPNGRSRHRVKVFYQVQVAVREVCHEAQDS